MSVGTLQWLLPAVEGQSNCKPSLEMGLCKPWAPDFLLPPAAGVPQAGIPRGLASRSPRGTREAGVGWTSAKVI